MGQHGPLGRTGRTGGEDQVRDVIRFDGRPVVPAGHPLMSTGGQHVAPRRSGDPGIVECHHGESGRPGGQPGHPLGVVHPEEVTSGEYHSHSRPVEDVAGLACRVPGVDGYENRPDPVDGERGHDPSRRVGGPDGDSVALAHPERGQSDRTVVDQPGELPVREVGSGADDGIGLGPGQGGTG